MLVYAVSGYTIQRVKHGALHRQLPSFILDAQAQGITDEGHAEQVARHIINPTGDPDIAVHVTCLPFDIPMCPGAG
jgi:hypothetical protein